jgi:hypothetical protein
VVGGGGGEGKSIVATDGDLHGLIYLLCEVATNKYSWALKGAVAQA